MSKQVSNNPRKYLAALKIRPSAYATLLTFGRRVSSYVLAAVATFATPSPALADLDTALDDLQDAMAAKGNKNNRGSKISNNDCKAKAEIVRGILLQLLDYVQATVGAEGLPNLQASALYSTSGMAYKKKPRISTNRVQPIRDFKIVTTPSIPFPTYTFKWKKPQGLTKGASLKGYALGAYSEDGKFQLLAFTTKTTWEVPGHVHSDEDTLITIHPVTSFGYGMPFRTIIPRWTNLP